MYEKNVRSVANQLRGQGFKQIETPFGMALLDDEVLTLYVSKLPQPVAKGSDPGLVLLELPRDE